MVDFVGEYEIIPDHMKFFNFKIKHHFHDFSTFSLLFYKMLYSGCEWHWSLMNKKIPIKTVECCWELLNCRIKKNRGIAWYIFELLITQKLTIMKTKFIPVMSLIIFTMIVSLSATAQKAGNKQTALNLSPSEISRSFPVERVYSDIIEIEKISLKLSNRFNKLFKKAINVKWYKAGDNFLAEFKTEETLNTSLFDKKGRLIYSVNYGSQKQLPASIKKMITDKYEGYEITSVAKVLQDNRKIWIVKLAGKSNYIAARVEDGEMQEVENFQRSN